jgi:hypothetical protein
VYTYEEKSKGVYSYRLVGIRRRIGMNLIKYLNIALNTRLNLENSNKDRMQVYPHTGIGKVVYAPSVKGVCDPTWVILECEKSIVDYYTWFLAKKGVKLEFPMWGSHLSVVRGEIQDIESCENWGYRGNEVVTFQYGDLVTNGKHWWLEAVSPELDEIRRVLGLAPHPKSGFHVTLGKIISLR